MSALRAVLWDFLRAGGGHPSYIDGDDPLWEMEVLKAIKEDAEEPQRVEKIEKKPLIHGRGPAFWFGSYKLVRDAVIEHLPECVFDDDVAEEAIIVDAIKAAGDDLRKLRTDLFIKSLTPPISYQLDIWEIAALDNAIEHTSDEWKTAGRRIVERLRVRCASRQATAEQRKAVWVTFLRKPLPVTANPGRGRDLTR